MTDTQLLACSSSQSVLAIACRCCLRALLCFGFFLLAVSACTITAGQTNNSLAASLDGEISPSDPLLQAESFVPLLPASAATSAQQSPSTVSTPVVAVSVYDPALIAVIVNAVKASLAAEKGSGSTPSTVHGNPVSIEPQAASGDVPAPSPSQRHARVRLQPKYPPIIVRFPPVKNLSYIPDGFSLWPRCPDGKI